MRPMVRQHSPELLPTPPEAGYRSFRRRSRFVSYDEGLVSPIAVFGQTPESPRPALDRLRGRMANEAKRGTGASPASAYVPIPSRMWGAPQHRAGGHNAAHVGPYAYCPEHPTRLFPECRIGSRPAGLRTGSQRFRLLAGLLTVRRYLSSSSIHHPVTGCSQACVRIEISPCDERLRWLRTMGSKLHHVSPPLGVVELPPTQPTEPHVPADVEPKPACTPGAVPSAPRKWS